MMKITIISYNKIIFKSNKNTVRSITLPGLNGKFQILKNHAPLISILKNGVIKINFLSKKIKIPINGGFLYTKKNIVIIIL
ncbi:FoF1 ATP synthase subunit delta/epsilon [Blattabacterium cuenoti]|uniref:FoF1 ATP synthase subunit delta/epsilon n=1 Tax=Blattabacterium cuenoti TaxID=1653831 RepID=UPI001EE9C41D|nr:F0F1 ATP synthase subunit epsilon [Blattabacterium cuenoti]